jgi:type II secretory pathway pseudopilin PulG
MRKIFHTPTNVRGLCPIGLERYQFNLIQPGTQGFTRLELIAVLAVLVVIAALAVPALANTRLRSLRVACVNNLSQIGRAYDMWATDHAGRYPMTVPYWEGGLYAASPSPPGSILPSFLASGLQANTWFQFWSLSNELKSPKMLACPSDAERRRATEFDFYPSGGFLHASFRNQATSYFLGHPLMEAGRAVLSGDRNVGSVPSQGACPYFGIANSINSALWGTNIHVNSGNLLFNDGSIIQSDQAILRAALTSTNSGDNYNVHVLVPQ